MLPVAVLAAAAVAAVGEVTVRVGVIMDQARAAARDSPALSFLDQAVHVINKVQIFFRRLAKYFPCRK